MHCVVLIKAMHSLALGTDLCSVSLWWSAIPAGDISAPWLRLSLHLSRRSLDQKQREAIPFSGECIIIIFKTAIRSHAKSCPPVLCLVTLPNKVSMGDKY